MTPHPSPPHPTRSRFARLHPKAYLGLHAAVGLLVAVLMTWAFLAIAEDVPEKGTMVQWDVAATTWLQHHGTEWGESIFLAVSYCGAQLLSAILVATGILFIYRRDFRHLVVLLVTAGGGALLNTALKAVFHRARPGVAAEFHATSWSFPSGHAMDSLIGYGLLAYWLGDRFPGARRWLYAACALIVICVGYARIYLGVHYVSDVVAGYCAGLIWLVVCITGYGFAEQRRLGPGGRDEAASREPATS